MRRRDAGALLTGGAPRARLAAAVLRGWRAPSDGAHLTMPGVDGVEATRRVRAQQRPPAVVALSGSRELIRDAVAAGAAFTLLKDEDPHRLLEVIEAAADA